MTDVIAVPAFGAADATALPPKQISPRDYDVDAPLRRMAKRFHKIGRSYNVSHPTADRGLFY
jgi:hypothetical protein